MNEKDYVLKEKIINQCADEIFKYSPQLFILKNEIKPIRPEALATCVLYQDGDSFYLITARHVFKNHDHTKIGILINDEFSYLHGFTILTEDKDNKIDIAIMKLYDHFSKKLQEEYFFLDDSFINFNHDFIHRQNYLMAGYPVHMSKIYATTHKREQLISLTHPSQKDNYSKLLLDKSHHITLDIEKIRSFKNITQDVKGPTLYGMSGSGLWVINFSKEASFKLVGIMIEWHKEEKVTVATKIDLVINIIRYRIEDKYKKALSELSK